ncbi:NmrA family NAD(P)-binding protein [Streptomyces sp. NPDC049954]|uniref:NmrA family NAD(P)-binding protein n=1 Tax=Streptomyces sp. NPDC049954 TaxID=3155779 RepID=UPI003419F6D2
MIVVTTPTGQVGHQVLASLVGAGEDVRVVVRDPARLDPGPRARVEVVEGSHDDPDVLKRALAGAGGLFWLVPPNPRADDILEHYLSFTRPACEAITEQGVRRVVAVSSLGRGYGKDAGQLTPAFRMDELIESTGVAYRSLAMPFYMENLLGMAGAIREQGLFFLPSRADQVLPVVATRDIADRAARLLRDDSWSGQGSVVVSSADELTPEGLAEVMSEVLERPVRYQQADLETYRSTMEQFGTPAWAQGMVAMAEAQNDGAYDAELNAPYTPAPTDFRTWCEAVLKPAVTG